MKTIFIQLILILALSAGSVFAQTAKVQVIHNSADIAAEYVDVYINGAKAIDNFMFRSATPFLELPAGVNIEIAIAGPESESVSEAIATFDYVLASGKTYVIVASGIVSAEGYTPAQAFDLYVYAMGREAATTETNTDVLVFHGSTDAPVVDVYESSVPAGTIIDNFAYGEFAGYLELATSDYVLEVKDETGMVTVVSYDAPLASLGLDGQALVVLASGFLNPAVNSDGPSFGLYVALASGGELIPLPVSMAKVQVIHNSADAAAEYVDVYINGAKAIDNFMFRSATPFLELPAGVNIEVAIAGPESESGSEAIATFDYVLASGETYVIVANGIVSAEGYTPAQAFDLYVYAMGREAATTETNTDVLVFHGSTDAPVVDVYESSVPAGTIIDNFAYGEFAGYLELATSDYVLEVKDETGMVTVVSYDAPLASLGLDGQALVVLASGFLNPAVNSDGPSFGLYVALASGGELIPLPVSMAKVQVIHNSADAAAEYVDVYINGAKAIDNFMFRSATPFFELPAGVNIEIAIAGPESESVSGAIATFDYVLASGETYVIVANGIVSAEGYTPAQAFDLYVYAMGRETATSEDNTDVLVFHGSTDAPVVDVYESSVPAGTIIDNFAYGEFAGYLELPTADYVLQVKDETGTVTVVSYDAPLATLGLDGQALVVLASGFLNPAVNSDGPGFGLYVALAAGGELIALPLTSTTGIESEYYDQVSVFPNPASDYLRIGGISSDSQVSVNFYNNLGQNVLSKLHTGEEIVISTSDFEAGIYYLNINYDNVSMTKTIQIIK